MGVGGVCVHMGTYVYAVCVKAIEEWPPDDSLMGHFLNC